jgi:hypothetical protein
MLNAVPPRYTSAEVGLTRLATCPLCGTQEQDERIERLWVRCPLVGGVAICEGCCYDYQGLARSEDFEDDPFVTLFEELAARVATPVQTLRRRCLEHQQEIVAEQLAATDASREQDALLGLAARISEAVLEASRG